MLQRHERVAEVAEFPLGEDVVGIVVELRELPLCDDKIKNCENAVIYKPSPLLLKKLKNFLYKRTFHQEAS